MMRVYQIFSAAWPDGTYLIAPAGATMADALTIYYSNLPAPPAPSGYGSTPPDPEPTDCRYVGNSLNDF